MFQFSEPSSIANKQLGLNRRMDSKTIFLLFALFLTIAISVNAAHSTVLQSGGKFGVLYALHS